MSANRSIFLCLLVDIEDPSLNHQLQGLEGPIRKLLENEDCHLYTTGDILSGIRSEWEDGTSGLPICGLQSLMGTHISNLEEFIQEGGFGKLTERGYEIRGVITQISIKKAVRENKWGGYKDLFELVGVFRKEDIPVSINPGGAAKMARAISEGTLHQMADYFAENFKERIMEPLRELQQGVVV